MYTRLNECIELLCTFLGDLFMTNTLFKIPKIRPNILYKDSFPCNF